MTAGDAGWWRVDVPTPAPAPTTGSWLDGGEARPDPAAPCSRDGVHGLSRPSTTRASPGPTTQWRGAAAGRRGPLRAARRHLHPEGTFDARDRAARPPRRPRRRRRRAAALQRLRRRAGAGATTGSRWFAVHEPYGGPDGLKRFVDACHARGLGVVMDVVYNHLGPAGNYLPEFGPYLTDAHTTPGARRSTSTGRVRRGPPLRPRQRAACGCATSTSTACGSTPSTPSSTSAPCHLLEELRARSRRSAAELGKPLWLVAETDLNDPRLVSCRGGRRLRPRRPVGRRRPPRPARHPHRRASTATTATSARSPTLAKALSGVFLHDGSWSCFRGRTHGRPVPATVPGHRFVVYLQDHDQIGNRAIGDRISATLSDGLLKVGAALVLTSPYTPMLFMGEEWGARTPWQFFSDHEGELGDAVREGRRGGVRVARLEHRATCPTRRRSRPARDSQLDWSELEGERGQGLLAWTRDLLALRRSRPELTDGRRDRVQVAYDEDARWLVVQRGRLVVACQPVDVSGRPCRSPARRSRCCSTAARASSTAPARWRRTASPWSCWSLPSRCSWRWAVPDAARSGLVRRRRWYPGRSRLDRRGRAVRCRHPRDQVVVRSRAGNGPSHHE